MKLKYLFLFFTISIFTSSTCDKVSSPSKTNTYEVCDEIVNAAQNYWIINKDSIYAPDLKHYCDISFVKEFKDAFSSNKDCHNSITLQEMKLLLGEPGRITPGISIFKIYGFTLASVIDTNKTYQTIFYECVTNKESRFDVSGKKRETQKYYFLFEKETGRYVKCLPMRGETPF